MNIKRLTTKTAMLLCIGFLTVQCTHEDEDVIPIQGPDPVEHGEEKFQCADCDVADPTPGDWYFDQNHSNVMWETPYKAFAANLTGRFNDFVVQSITFDEASPSDIAFEGFVYLNTVNTGEPHRDEGCLLGYFGTDGAKTDESENKASLVSVPNSGRYSEIAGDDSFIVDADMTFLGQTERLTVKLIYHPQSDQGDFLLGGITAEFNFSPLDDFGLDNANIDPTFAKVTMNLNFRNKK